MSAERSNAITRRLELLYDQWEGFLEQPDARILRWKLRSGEYRMFEAFLVTEDEPDAGRLPAYFLWLGDAFEHANTYGWTVRNRLIERWNLALEQQEVAASDWEIPAISGGDDIQALVHTLTSFQAAHAPMMEHVVLVLTPERALAADWSAWLLHLANALPATCRVIITDSEEQPNFDELGAQLPAVWSQSANLDMPGALEELASAAPGGDEPGGIFRVAFTKLCAAAGRNDLRAVDEHATVAKRAAQDAKAPHLICAVDMAQGNALLQSQQPLEAITAFQRADQAAQQAGPETSQKLSLTAQLSVGAALVSTSAWSQAAGVYEGAAKTAQGCEDPIQHVDSLRMAAYCHHRAQRPDQAWNRGLEALKAGEALPQAERAHSTLPYAGQALIDLTAELPTYAAQAQAIELEMVRLIGQADWRPTH